MKKILIAAIMFFSISAASSAQNNFNLDSMSVSGLKAMEEIAIEDVSTPAQAYAFIPQSKSPLVTPALDLSIKLPFDMINERIAEVKEVGLILHSLF
ncbi:MAG: hypothetical protein U9Q34_04995 [Elusimicrobiota bacterium]|nr:hypothetical protein [Elusimicrobiota bacterium]